MTVESSEQKQTSVNLFAEVCSIIDNSRRHLAIYANTEIIVTKWQIGNRIRKDVLNDDRADYGKTIVKSLAQRLTTKYGKGWSEKTLRHCLRAAETFTQDEIVSAARRQLTWTHLKSIMYVKDDMARLFYTEMCCREHWDTRTLDDKIDKNLYLQTALSRMPEDVIRQELEVVKTKNQLVPEMVFRSSYFLDMLGLPDIYSEKDLESAIITQIEEFLKELGTDFSFIGRQKRITIDATDYYMDLLFYHRELCRLVCIELKLGKFKPEYEGQMLLYLRYLNKNVRKHWEASPIGLILCSEGNTEHIEYLMLDENSPIKVAQYYTKLPDKKLLAEKLKRAVAIAKEKLAEDNKDE